jgi:hypothetical protein
MALYTVPSKFYLDHMNRCDLCYEHPLKAVKVGKLLTILDLDQAMFEDLYSDADYYASLKGGWDSDYEENRAIIDSAVNTLKRLAKEVK